MPVRKVSFIYVCPPTSNPSSVEVRDPNTERFFLEMTEII